MTRTTAPNRAAARLKAGKFSATAKLEVSSTGLLAIGALVSGILLSTSALVWTATAVPRARPGLATLKR
jgi:hypothetical protein